MALFQVFVDLMVVECMADVLIMIHVNAPWGTLVTSAANDVRIHLRTVNYTLKPCSH